MKHLSIFVGLGFLLSGCVTQNNLLTNKGQMDDATFEIVERLAEKASSTCTTYTYTEGPVHRAVSGQMKMRGNIVVLNLYTSDSKWYRAGLVVDRVWDNVYYNDSTGQIVCGDKQWTDSGYAGKTVFKPNEAGAVR